MGTFFLILLIITAIALWPLTWAICILAATILWGLILLTIGVIVLAIIYVINFMKGFLKGNK